MTDKPLTDADLGRMVVRAAAPFVDTVTRANLHSLVAEVRRLRAMLPCPECACNVAMHALTCSRGGRTG